MTTLLWPVRPRSFGGVVARGALDQHVQRPAHEALRALVRPPLDDLDEPLHPLDRHLVVDELVDELGRLGRRAAASR